ncbi:creatininase family protein [Streptomyces sp. NPDC087658]|uniref:creatininase family protein n=1 Tax=Streptomyces sp. NPDC087658 TaxID=3365800 RepID=UPI00382F09E1
MTGSRPGSRSYADLTSAEAAGVLSGHTVVWPVGATEQHGPHLPLSVDSVLAEEFARAIAEELDGFVLPVQSVAARSLPQSGGGLSFPGTLHVNGDTLIRFLREALLSLTELPFSCLLVVNGHFENEPFIFEALDQVRQQGALDGKEVLAFSWWSLVQESWLRAELPEFPGWHAEHAGVTETSLTLYLRPDLVREARPGHDRPPRSGVYLHPIDVARTTNEGVLSSTSGSSRALGEKLFHHVVAEALALIRSGEGLLARSWPEHRGDSAAPDAHTVPTTTIRTEESETS